MPEFILRRSEIEECGAFEMTTGFEVEGLAEGDERGEVVRGDGDVGEFGEEEETVDVGGLGDFDCGEVGGALEEGEGDVGVGGETELAH